MDSCSIRTEDSAKEVPKEPTQCSSRTKQILNTNCFTTSKKHSAFRRCRPGDGFSRPASSKLKPYNAFTPLSELRQISIIVPGPNTLCNSFEANQSFPRIGRRSTRYGGQLSRASLISKINSPVRLSWHSMANMDRVRVDGSNGVRFTAFRPKGSCYPHGVSSPYNNSYIASTSESIGRLPKSDINPNKAVFTIDSKTSRILIVNRNACELLGYNSKELCEMEFTSLLLNKNKMHVSALAEGQLNSEDGTVIILSGKVVELCTKHDKNVAVSLWVRQIDTEGQRCLAVAEPVERRIAQVVIDPNGYIISADNEALMLFQLDSVDKFGGMDVTLLIPAIQLPDPDSSLIAKHIRKQKATGKTQDGVSFPLCLMISHHETGTDTTDSGLSNPNALLYMITIWVYTNLSGLLVIDENSLIESCNHHFSMLMFGIPQSKTIGEHITKLIPNFGQESDCLTRSRNATLSSLDNDESETETDHVELETNKGDFLQGALNDIKPSHCDNASPVMEPRKVCLDFTNVSHTGKRSFNGSTVAVTSTLPGESTADGTDAGQAVVGGSECVTDEPGNQYSIVVTSEKIIYVEDNSENNRNYANVSNAQNSHALKPCTSSLTSSPAPSTNASASNNASASGALRDAEEVANKFNSVLASEEYVNVSESDLLTPVNENSLCMNLLNSKNVSINVTKSPLYTSEDINVALLKDSTPASAPPVLVTPRFIKPYDLAKGAGSLVTSTPDQHKRHSAGGINDLIRQMGISAKRMSYVDGKYRGEAIHYDGNVIDIIYTISSQMLPCGRKVYCIWISRDPESSYNNLEEANVTLTFNSITSTIDNSLGQPGKSTNTAAAVVAAGQSRPNSVSLVSQCEEEQVFGEYNKHYTTIKQIGKGAYGYVKLSYRNTDRLLMISKFILKEKLCSNFMIATEDKKEIPMEIYLLTHVKHPNIVTVFDVFENEKFFQLVMEVHGSGMDLFEFIDRRPALTEKLGCYIFRQIANAVDYLHSLNILHRDIKDENIIIDQHFHVKLIDFGSATFMQEGKLFSTFYGTTEYCSPEVLAGNKYAGPELEMWSLGVTLYVLMFFENPFLDIEETLKSELIIPQEISPELEYVLLALLDKNPKTRITMKQLIATEWLTQDINPSTFNFAQIVPCEPYEVNPEKYYNGQIYSSQTGLSTSPHSLSLVDDEDEGDDEDDEPHAHIDDSFVDPEELQDDELCPLSHDDEKPPEQSYEIYSARDTHAATMLAKGIHNLSLQENIETKYTASCTNQNSPKDSAKIVEVIRTDLLANYDKEKQIISIVVKSDQAEMQHHPGQQELSEGDEVPTSTKRTKCNLAMVKQNTKETNLHQQYHHDDDGDTSNGEHIVNGCCAPHQMILVVTDQEENNHTIDTDYENEEFEEEDIDDR
ncbi:PAS domain-containing serine/threonine-protein kinase isoform X1 [Anopheles funestus]|uniref:PAS domain-containing serine/threonine-protein kinase isoform X1 n=1 Tax=Anopheles funestus TaxID=62324 RepID=UPI0020C665CD|nr:PAS domain-containing serine/threonine-protein kinase isoform X1 [Anopheles funestus]XP_049289624.1 PAS domain-containing serine/threonine-protein kinase isoform X1 [Anopheles funestus]XP_049289625.1 PAS domain-containing serine/threonine-protein kinase isoform X1 [Anopheles funestus]